MSDRESGFTLIEMLVALAVFSLAALALIRLNAATVRTSADVATRTMGQIVAQNIVAETLTDPTAPAIGRAVGTTENGGRSWIWSRTTSRTADPAIVRVDVTVTDPQRRFAGALTVARKAK
jgi:general secretion pathway protein I